MAGDSTGVPDSAGVPDSSIVPGSAHQHARSPISKRQQRRLAKAVDRAEELTGLQLAVYLGPTEDDSRAHAESIFASMGYHDLPGVLVLVAPDQRRLEIVTSASARRRISDRHAALTATSMTASFAVGDIVGGVCLGLDMLARYAGLAPAGETTDRELPDVIMGYDDPA